MRRSPLEVGVHNSQTFVSDAKYGVKYTEARNYIWCWVAKKPRTFLCIPFQIHLHISLSKSIADLFHIKKLPFCMTVRICICTVPHFSCNPDIIESWAYSWSFLQPLLSLKSSDGVSPWTG
jgi:hypothetical protein